VSGAAAMLTRGQRKVDDDRAENIKRNVNGAALVARLDWIGFRTGGRAAGAAPKSAIYCAASAFRAAVF